MAIKEGVKARAAALDEAVSQSAQVKGDISIFIVFICVFIYVFEMSEELLTKNYQNYGTMINLNCRVNIFVLNCISFHETLPNHRG